MAKEDLRKNIASTKPTNPRKTLFQVAASYNDNPVEEEKKITKEEVSVEPVKTTEITETESKIKTTSTQRALEKTENTKDIDIIDDNVYENVIKSIIRADRKKKNEESSFKRKTYFLSPELIEAIRIYSYTERIDKSEVVRILLEKAMPAEYMNTAIKNIQND